MLYLKGIVWKNKSNGQLCVTVGKNKGIQDGDIVEVRKKKLKKLVYSPVVGDLFHYGHLQSVLFAHSLGDYHVCGVFTDKAVEEYRSKPIANLQERKAIFENLTCVDRVMVQQTKDPTENLQRLHEEFPDAEVILVHGSNWQIVPGAEFVQGIGGKLVQHPYYERLSTYRIINQLLEQHDRFKDIREFTSFIGGQEKYDAERYKNTSIVSSTARTLTALQPLLTASVVPSFFHFTVADWKKRKGIIAHIQKQFSGKIVVRASPINEKTFRGAIRSASVVAPVDQVESAVCSVIDGLDGFDHVIVQVHVDCMHFNLYRADEKYITNPPMLLSEPVMNAVHELEELLPTIDLDIELGIHGDCVYLLQVEPLVKQFVHAWGETTSLQAMECHTLRYLAHPDKLCNSIVRSMFCEVRNRHHTLYFDDKDVQRWHHEGLKMLDSAVQQELVADNVKQIEKYHAFVKAHENDAYSTMSNGDLLLAYSELLGLIMENGAYFAYSRQEATNLVKEKIASLAGDPDVFQLIITPTEEDLFLHEKKDRLVLLRSSRSDADIMAYARKHPWRFINTYSSALVLDFLHDELAHTDAVALERDIENTIAHARELRKKQEDYFRTVDGLKEPCYFLQKIAVVRLENKNVWSGFEFLFLPLFEEIARRAGLGVEDLLYSYRIEEIKDFLRSGKKLSADEVKKRQQYFNLEISSDAVVLSYEPKYSDLLQLSVEKGTLSGDVGNLGKVVGRALVVTDDSIASLQQLQETMTTEDIYVTTMTHPAMVSLLHRARGIVTDEGGVTSHAAIISRELGLPCLVGTKHATRFLKTGDLIELDVYNKQVRRISEKEYVRPVVQKQTDSAPFLVAHAVNANIPYTVHFTAKTSPSVTAAVGGKGKNLMVHSREHPVPAGFCITRRLYDEIVAAYLAQGSISLTPQELARLREFVQNYQFDSAIEKVLLQQFDALKAPLVAVRSSASAEDSLNASFAGQFETTLGVPREQFIGAVKSCIASAFSEHAARYLGHVGADDFFMGVVVQEFLPSEKAGVLFSRDPVHPEHKGFVINANFGVGESVVSGEVTPDHYVVRDDSTEVFVSEIKKAYFYENGKKEIVEKGGRVLTDEEIDQLYLLGQKLRSAHDHEIECEWCFVGGKLYLLQVRPVTTL